MIEIEKNKNGKCLVISVFTLPDDDELIKRPFIYWHTRTEHFLDLLDLWSLNWAFSRIIRSALSVLHLFVLGEDEMKQDIYLGASLSKHWLFLFTLVTKCGVANFRTLTIFLLSKIVHLPFFRKLFLRA